MKIGYLKLSKSCGTARQGYCLLVKRMPSWRTLFSMSSELDSTRGRMREEGGRKARRRP